MTHTELVDIGHRWLKQRCTICFTELVTYAEEIPDVIGWKGPNSILIECKVSRRDFLSDKKKLSRHRYGNGLGRVRYYLCPENVIQVEDLPEGWGLLWVKGRRVYVQREPGNHYQQSNQWREIGFLVSTLRRVKAKLGTGDLNRWIKNAVAKDPMQNEP